MRSPWRLLLIAPFVVAMGMAEVASATRVGAVDVGYDISYPQCGLRLPQLYAFGVVGVNGGRAFKENPCLDRQLMWAQRAENRWPAFYANTGNPGPYYSKHWPRGQTSPRVCSSDDPNSSACSFDYGWNAMNDSFANAVHAFQRVNHLNFSEARERAASVVWWLDVELANSWQTLEPRYRGTEGAKWNDVYALAGGIRALWNQGVDVVGVYSTRYQWNEITGGSDYTHDWFSANPVWLAGADNTWEARRMCGQRGFTGGWVWMTQYLSHGFDANHSCV